MKNIEISTKDRIVYASIELFAEKGYNEASVRDIAKIVGIRASSIYNHFPSKEAILDHILDMYAKNTDNNVIPSGSNKLVNYNMSSEELLNYLFFKFSDENANIYQNIIKIIYAEYVHNEKVHNFLKNNIILASFDYLKCQLDYLKKLGIVNCNVVKTSSVLYSIIISYTVLSTLNMNYFMDTSDKDSEMFEVIKSILNSILVKQ